MKKKLAALLCGVMCVGAFSGCSTDELGYLKMAANAMDTMKTCEVKGTMQADINFDALELFMTDVAKATDADMVAKVLEARQDLRRRLALVAQPRGLLDQQSLRGDCVARVHDSGYGYNEIRYVL